jgi:hypothetical protein
MLAEDAAGEALGNTERRLLGIKLALASACPQARLTRYLAGALEAAGP